MMFNGRFLFLSALIGLMLAGPAQAYDLYDGNISLLSNQVDSSVGDVVGNRFRAGFEFKFKQSNPGELEKNFSMAAQYNDANSLLFSLREASLVHRFGRSEVTYGRQVLEWAPADEFWGFGKLNNRVNFNYFSPGQEGLTGINLRRQYENGFYFDIFGSIVNVPELNPGYEIDNDTGKIEAKNPWSNPPSDSATIASTSGSGSDEVPIKYYVDMPNMGEIILQASLGGNLGFTSEYIDFNVFAVRKPENTVTVAAEVTYENGDQSVNARVTPQVFYHDVYGGSIKLKADRLALSFHSLSIRPNSYPEGNELVTQYTSIETEKRDEDYLSVALDYESYRLSAGLNYVARVSEFDLTGDVLAIPPRWNQAMGLYVSARLSKSFDARFDIKYDTLTYDRLYTFELEYAVDRNVRLAGGAEIIGTPDNSDSFWSEYRNNDAVYGSLKYVF